MTYQTNAKTSWSTNSFRRVIGSSHVTTDGQSPQVTTSYRGEKNLIFNWQLTKMTYRALTWYPDTLPTPLRKAKIQAKDKTCLSSSAIECNVSHLSTVTINYIKMFSFCIPNVRVHVSAAPHFTNANIKFTNMAESRHTFNGNDILP